MPDVTSMKLSTETRDRLRVLAAETNAASLEDVVVMALDAYSNCSTGSTRPHGDARDVVRHIID
jgi:type IV pilus biogenesis protein CpaD/CtpE